MLDLERLFSEDWEHVNCHKTCQIRFREYLWAKVVKFSAGTLGGVGGMLTRSRDNHDQDLTGNIQYLEHRMVLLSSQLSV